MNKVIIIFAAFCVALAVAGPAADERPEPYAFSFESQDEYGTVQTRSESGDASGAVSGSYSFRDANGIQRTVRYTADDANGFQAVVDTNEPGTISSNPAAAVYNVK